MGPGVVDGVEYDSQAMEISGSVRGAPGFSPELVFWLPDGYSVKLAQVDGASNVSEEMRSDSVLVVSFTGPGEGWHQFRVSFE